MAPLSGVLAAPSHFRSTDTCEKPAQFFSGIFDFFVEPYSARPWEQTMVEHGTVSRLLDEVRRGNGQAKEQLARLLHEELYRLAAAAAATRARSLSCRAGAPTIRCH
jgi:hypothetical protein